MAELKVRFTQEQVGIALVINAIARGEINKADWEGCDITVAYHTFGRISLKLDNSGPQGGDDA